MQETITNKTFEKLKYDLVRSNLISYEDLTKAENIAQIQNKSLVQILIDQKIISEDALHEFIESKLHIPYVNLDDYKLDPNCLSYIDKQDAVNYKIIPLFRIEDVLTVAMTDPLNLFLFTNLLEGVDYKIEPVLCSERNISTAIQLHYNMDDPLYISSEEVFADDSDDENFYDKENFTWQNLLNNKNNIKPEELLYAIIYQAYQEEVEEVFFENDTDNLVVKFKKLKQYTNTGSIPVLLKSTFISNLKKVSELDPSIVDVPQLGTFKINLEQEESDKYLNIVVASFPTIKGERFSLKLYRPPMNIDEFKLDKASLNCIKSCLGKEGIILVCGESLSGKTSIIYSLLEYLQNKNKNIMTIESVIKYILPNINQCQLKEKAGFDFNKAIKHIYFQSPDVLYFEEIFDKDGFDFICSFASTGKIVLTEYTVENKQKFIKKLETPAFDNIKELVSCVIFVENNKIEVMKNKLLG